jgi:outer membrane receptor protein involved in Fe transport
MESIASNLKEVIVNSNKPLIENKEDRIIFNVEADLSLNGLMATDALQKTPFIMVDGEGNIQLNGKSGFLIQLNGRNSSLFARNPGEVLKTFPANLISRIEVITNPSSKYDGEGVSGIINIVTKKKLAGYNGSVGISVNSMWMLNGNTNFSYKKGRWAAKALFGYTRRPMPANSSLLTTVFLPGSYCAERFVDESLKTLSVTRNGNLEITYDVDSLSTWSVYFGLNGGITNKSSIKEILQRDIAGNALDKATFNGVNNLNRPGTDWGTDFSKKYKSKPGKELSISLNRQISLNDAFITSEQFYSTGNSFFLINDNHSKNIQTAFQIDYINPLKKKRSIEIGTKGIFRKVISDYVSMIRTSSSGAYIKDPGNTNQLNYSQNVGSIYGMYKVSVKKLFIQTGIRLEYTDILGQFSNTTQTVQQQYFTLLPSFTIKQDFKNNQSVTLSYSKRLTRPGITFLNPFINNADPLNISYGNPELSPDFANNIQLSYNRFKGKLGINGMLAYAAGSKEIRRLQEFDKSTGINTSTYANIGRSDNINATVFLNYKFNKKYSVVFTNSFNYITIKSDITGSPLSNSGFTGYLWTSFNYTSAKSLSANASFGMYVPPVELQSKAVPIYINSFSASYLLAHRKITATITLQNPFMQYWVNGTNTNTVSFNSIYRYSYIARTVGIALRYNFGKQKETTSKKKLKIDDQKDASNPIVN